MSRTRFRMNPRSAVRTLNHLAKLSYKYSQMHRKDKYSQRDSISVRWIECLFTK